MKGTGREATLDLKRAALAANRLAEHMRWVAQTIHQSHHEVSIPNWHVCGMSVCKSTHELLKILGKEAA
jgi:hypothetical protein